MQGRHETVADILISCGRRMAVVSNHDDARAALVLAVRQPFGAFLGLHLPPLKRQANVVVVVQRQTFPCVQQAAGCPLGAVLRFILVNIVRGGGDGVEVCILETSTLLHLLLHPSQEEQELFVRPTFGHAPIHQRRGGRVHLQAHAQLPDLLLKPKLSATEEHPLPVGIDKRRESRDKGGDQGQGEEDDPLEILVSLFFDEAIGHCDNDSGDTDEENEHVGKLGQLLVAPSVLMVHIVQHPGTSNEDKRLQHVRAGESLDLSKHLHLLLDLDEVEHVACLDIATAQDVPNREPLVFIARKLLLSLCGLVCFIL
mmetsp:Transcript_103235/g.210597  ORF Transcript_103235/g.210597 Transcript_103235/m.210597 type:complete len:313 (+) Transcript_103235:582-1520(+)